MPAATLRRISMKALARYQVILLGEQRCEQLAHGCCPNSAAVGVEPATSRSRVQRSNHYTTEPPNEYIYHFEVFFQRFNKRIIFKYSFLDTYGIVYSCKLTMLPWSLKFH